MNRLPHENARLASGVGQSKITTDEFCFPDHRSVKGRVLAGDKLTHMDVWQRHGSSRASHHILMLRKAGWPVITQEIDAPTSDGRVARIALYYLLPETIEGAGDRGQEFIAEARAARRAS